jgi:hypothetical protein
MERLIKILDKGVGVEVDKEVKLMFKKIIKIKKNRIKKIKIIII